MDYKKLTISLVVYNGLKYLPLLFQSLKEQTFQDFEIIVVDNASDDGSTNIILSTFASLSVNSAKDLLNYESRRDSSPRPGGAKNHSRRMRFIPNPTNIGFAAGYNKIFAQTNGEYFLVLNQDIYLAPDCLEKLVGFMDEHHDCAAVGPKLLKWNFNTTPNPSSIRRGDQIDSLGLRVLRNRQVIDIKKSSIINHQSSITEVFGVSAACALYRRNAINAVGGLFDPDYFMYKEDVDLAYRLSQAGFKARCLLDALAWHDRSGSGAGVNTDFAQARNKQNQSRLIKYYSYRNHLITLYKNEYWQNFLLDWPWILWYELKKFTYFLLFDRAVLAGWKDIWQMRKELRTKRLKIKRLRQINWRNTRRQLNIFRNS